MRFTPIKLPNGGNWGLRWPQELEEEAVREKLTHIPGLHFDAPNGRVYGLIDAVAVAAQRLGLPLPPRQTSKLEHTHVIHKKLRDYQQEGVAQVVASQAVNGGALLADDMGLGKTLQAIAITAATGGRTLICCPAFVRETWREELEKWMPGCSLVMLTPGSTKAIKKAWDTAPDAQYVITSYDLAGKAAEAAFGWTAPTSIIMDEAHILRGRKTKRLQDVLNVAVLSQYRLALTGTPMWSRPRDFYSLLRCLYGNRFGGQTDFDLAYCGGRINEHGGWDNRGAVRTEELRLRLSYYMVRRMRQDVLKELPPLTRQVVWIDGNKQAEAAMWRAMSSKSPGSTYEALHATLEAKIEAALHLAHQAKRFLLFTYTKSHAHQMHKVLMDEGTPCVLITGEKSHAQRHAAVQLAKEKGWGVVATLDSLKEGVNMQGVASVGIMHALDYVPLKMLQGEARIYRMGQVDPTVWYYLACKNSMDARVVGTVVEKLDQWRALMGTEETKGLRNALNDHIDGAGEQSALKALYDALPEE